MRSRPMQRSTVRAFAALHALALGAMLVACRGTPPPRAAPVAPSAAPTSAPAPPATPPQLVTVERGGMGTRFRVQLVGREDERSKAAIEACFSHYERVDVLMSEWKPDSPLSAVSRASGREPVPVPDELLDVLAQAKEVAANTGGAFDPTWAALWDLWKFDGTDRVPTKKQVAHQLRKVGHHKLVLDTENSTAFLTERGMVLGLGGIAKGYALGECATELQARGYNDFLLYSGGQVHAGGTREGKPWRVGVQDPRGNPGEVFASLEITDASVSTSGDYERSFIKDGVRYHHILDTKTGFPARASWSATVVHRDPTLADAYSTAAFVAGPERALELAELIGFEVLLVDAKGEVHGSPRLLAGVQRPPTVRSP